MIELERYQKFGCIGSKRLNGKPAQFCLELGCALATHNKLIVSGNCTGADQAFANGANLVDPRLVRVYLPWPEFNKNAIVKGNQVHQVDLITGQDHWEKFGMNEAFGPMRMLKTTIPLFSRNINIVDDSDIIIAWPGGGRGTRSGMYYAKQRGKTVINLCDVSTRKAIAEQFGIDVVA